MPLHLKAERLSSRYVHRLPITRLHVLESTPKERYRKASSKQFERRSVRDVIENPREDEFYVLVMRYVPMEIRRRGLKIKEVFDEWDRDLAPSPSLIRRWKKEPPTRQRWKEYTRRYLEEVPPVLIRRKAEVHKESAKGRKVFFVCKEEDWEHPYCHIWIILDVLKGKYR